MTVVVEKVALPGDVAVTVMVTDPAATAVTTPVGETVAMLVSDEVYVTVADGAPVGCVTVDVSARVWPTVTVAEVGETERLVIPGGGVCTVMVAVPTTPSIVAVMVAEPAEMPVTSPFVLTVATEALSVAQLTVRPVSVCPAESRAETTNCCVAPVRMLALAGATLTVATGTSVTVTVTVAVRDAAEYPVFPADDAVTVMVAVPGPTATTSPADDTVAMLGAVVP